MRQVYEEMARLIKEGQEFVLTVVVNAEESTAGKQGFKMIVLPDGKTVGTIGGGGLELKAIEWAKELFKTKGSIYKKFVLKEGEPSSFGMTCGGEMEIYMEYVGFRKHFVIFGAGHLGKMIYEIARLSNEYDFVVVDEREEFANKQVFPEAEIWSGLGVYEKTSEIPLRDGAVVIIVTPHGAADHLILKGLQDKGISYEYIGMIGSINRKSNTFKNAVNIGVRDDFLKKIFSPVGIAIGSETPFEICIAILAELIALRKNALRNVKSERNSHETD